MTMQENDLYQGGSPEKNRAILNSLEQQIDSNPNPSGDQIDIFIAQLADLETSLTDDASGGDLAMLSQIDEMITGLKRKKEKTVPTTAAIPTTPDVPIAPVSPPVEPVTQVDTPPAEPIKTNPDEYETERRDMYRAVNEADVTRDQLMDLRTQCVALIGKIMERMADPAQADDAGLEKALNQFKTLLEFIRMKIEVAVSAKEAPPAPAKVISATEETLRQKTDLFELLTSMETSDGLGAQETVFAYETVIRERTVELAAEILDEAERKAFIQLCTEQIVPLYEFGVLTPASISGTHLTVKSEDAILDALSKSGGSGTGALSFNTEFNKNLLINSGEVDNQQYRPDMGIIQKVVCAMYAEMCNYDSEFARTGAYPDGKAKKLIEMICSQPTYTVVDEEGIEHQLEIAAEIDKFPEGVKKVLKYVIGLKASRDDLGNKASNFIMATYGKSPKIGGTGSGASDAGYIARAIYKAAQTSNNQEYTAVLSYVDPTDLEALQPKEDHDTHKMVDDPRRAVLIRKRALIDNYFSFLRAGWETQARNLIVYVPERWDYDFPSLDDYTNKIDGLSPADRKLARNALREIITLAYSSTKIRLPSRYDLMKQQLESQMSTMTTKIAELTAYIQKPDAIGAPEPRNVRYTKYHGIALAATKFFVANLIMNVPASMVSGTEDVWNRVTSLGNERHNEDAKRLHEQAVAVILDQITNYTSISGVYAEELAKVANAAWLRPEYVNPTTRKNRYNRRRIELDPNLSSLDPREKDAEYARSAVLPFVPAKDTTADSH